MKLSTYGKRPQRPLVQVRQLHPATELRELSVVQSSVQSSPPPRRRSSARRSSRAAQSSGTAQSQEQEITSAPATSFSAQASSNSSIRTEASETGRPSSSASSLTALSDIETDAGALSPPSTSHDDDDEEYCLSSDSDHDSEDADRTTGPRTRSTRAKTPVFFGTPSKDELDHRDRYSRKVRERRLLRRDSLDLARRKTLTMDEVEDAARVLREEREAEHGGAEASVSHELQQTEDPPAQKDAQGSADGLSDAEELEEQDSHSPSGIEQDVQHIDRDELNDLAANADLPEGYDHASPLNAAVYESSRVADLSSAADEAFDESSVHDEETDSDQTQVVEQADLQASLEDRLPEHSDFTVDSTPVSEEDHTDEPAVPELDLVAEAQLCDQEERPSAEGSVAEVDFTAESVIAPVSQEEAPQETTAVALMLVAAEAQDMPVAAYQDETLRFDLLETADDSSASLEPTVLPANDTYCDETLLLEDLEEATSAEQHQSLSIDVNSTLQASHQGLTSFDETLAFDELELRQQSTRNLDTLDAKAQEDVSFSSDASDETINDAPNHVVVAESPRSIGPSGYDQTVCFEDLEARESIGSPQQVVEQAPIRPGFLDETLNLERLEDVTLEIETSPKEPLGAAEVADETLCLERLELDVSTVACSEPAEALEAMDQQDQTLAFDKLEQGLMLDQPSLELGLSQGNAAPVEQEDETLAFDRLEEELALASPTEAAGLEENSETESLDVQDPDDVFASRINVAGPLASLQDVHTPLRSLPAPRSPVTPTSFGSPGIGLGNQTFGQNSVEARRRILSPLASFKDQYTGRNTPPSHLTPALLTPRTMNVYLSREKIDLSPTIGKKRVDVQDDPSSQSKMAKVWSAIRPSSRASPTKGTPRSLKRSEPDSHLDLATQNVDPSPSKVKSPDLDRLKEYRDALLQQSPSKSPRRVTKRIRPESPAVTGSAASPARRGFYEEAIGYWQKGTPSLDATVKATEDAHAVQDLATTKALDQNKESGESKSTQATTTDKTTSPIKASTSPSKLARPVMSKLPKPSVAPSKIVRPGQLSTSRLPAAIAPRSEKVSTMAAPSVPSKANRTIQPPQGPGLGMRKPSTLLARQPALVRPASASSNSSAGSMIARKGSISALRKVSKSSDGSSLFGNSQKNTDWLHKRPASDVESDHAGSGSGSPVELSASSYAHLTGTKEQYPVEQPAMERARDTLPVDATALESTVAPQSAPVQAYIDSSSPPAKPLYSPVKKASTRDVNASRARRVPVGSKEAIFAPQQSKTQASATNRAGLASTSSTTTRPNGPATTIIRAATGRKKIVESSKPEAESATALKVSEPASADMKAASTGSKSSKPTAETPAGSSAEMATSKAAAATARRPRAPSSSSSVGPASRAVRVKPGPSKANVDSFPSVPISSAALASLTARNHRRNEQYHVKIETVVVRIEGPRPPSPTSKIPKTGQAGSRRLPSGQAAEARASRAMKRARASQEGVDSTDVHGEKPLEPWEEEWNDVHRIGAGEEVAYQTPSKLQTINPGNRATVKGIRWQRSLFKGPNEASSTITQEQPSSKGPLRSCLKAKDYGLDRHGNTRTADAPPSPRWKRGKVVVTKVIYDDDDQMDEELDAREEVRDYEDEDDEDY